jgi:hypothetical protein
LATSPCKNKFVENLLKKILEEAKAHIWAVAPLMMMMMMMMMKNVDWTSVTHENLTQDFGPKVSTRVT